MSALFRQFGAQPMLLTKTDGQIVAEPLRFIPLGSLSATRRDLRQRLGNSVGSQSVHADLTTQNGRQHHGA